jgi:DNA-binding NarL/FixJ family response regulator
MMTTESALKPPEAAAAHVRILVADDHEVMRLGIRNLLEAKPNWTVCAEAKNGQEAVSKAVELQPDVIIMDLTMPTMNGLEAAERITRSNPEIPVVHFSLHLSDDLVNHFEGGSIRGAVSKSNAARDLVEAVEKVLNGETFFPNKGRNPANSHSSQ